jgi:hypothetical protein
VSAQRCGLDDPGHISEQRGGPGDVQHAGIRRRRVVEHCLKHRPLAKELVTTMRPIGSQGSIDSMTL